MPLPSLTAEIAFDSGFATAEGSRTWTDISDYVEGASGAEITYGRADELSQADPNRLTITLDNRLGYFTPGNASSPFSPNVKKGKPIRVSVRYAEDGSGNLLSANAASMETSVAAWSAGGTVPPALAQSATHVDNGTNALRITWGTGGVLPLAQTTVSGLSVGRTYTAQARVWVTAGTPDVLLGVSGISTGSATSTKSAFATISYTFTATATSHVLQVRPTTSPTSGQQLWVDSVMVDEGSSVGTFTTSPPPVSVRFTGYVNEWPVAWPQGTSDSSLVTITATSRKARLGQTAPLTSAIRAAYLATSPDAYWLMSEELLNNSGQYVFLDITNTLVNNKPTQALSAFNTDPTLSPMLLHDAPGPTDEGGMVKVPAFTNPALIGTYTHFVGAGTAININTAGNVSAEVVVRWVPTGIPGYLFEVMDLFSRENAERFYMYAADSDNLGTVLLACQILQTNPDTGATIATSGSFFSGGVVNALADGELHHLAMTMSGGVTTKLYFDGELLDTDTMVGGSITRRLTNIAFASDTYQGAAWVGHGAVHDRALTDAEVADHAAAATAATETVEERVARIAGRIGVPADEIDVETSIAALLGSQPESGRSAAEVIDEAAASTGSVLYDTREGHLALQARNHRYNLASAFTLSATLQEIEADLSPVMDDRYLVNTVEFTREGAEGVPATLTDDSSIEAYGIYAKTFSIVSSSDTEVEAAAQNLLYLYAEPIPRYTQVSVDVGNLSNSQRVLVLAADIGTRFTGTGLPAQAPATSEAMFLEGYTETISDAAHRISMNTTPGAVYQNVFIWDDATHGVWDTDDVWAY